MKNTIPPLLVAAVLLGGCGPRDAATSDATTDVTAQPSGATLNPASTVTESTSDTPTGQADVADAETGTNSGRPDAPRDLKPGTDGNTTPSAQER